MPTTGINKTTESLIKWASVAFFVSKRGRKGAFSDDFDFFDEVGVLFGKLFGDVEVNVFRDVAAGMSEATAYHIQRDAVLSEKSHMRVPERMDCQTPADDPLGVLPEVFGIDIVTDIVPVCVREKQIRPLAGDLEDLPLPFDDIETALV